MDMHQRFDAWWKNGISVMEKIVALAVVLAVVTYACSSVVVLVTMDWAVTETYYEVINRVLAVIIGLELVRMLISHSIASVLELLAFVIARKMLKPDLGSVDIMAGVLAFVALMAARHFFTESAFLEDSSKQDSAPSKRSNN